MSVNRAVLQKIVTTFEAKRPIDLKEVASHEFMHLPISIFDTSGNIRSGVKSTMVQPLMGDQHNLPLPSHPPEQSTLIIDMMARVQAIGLPTQARTFGDLADVVVSSIFTSGRDFHRIEVVGDQYLSVSIKDSTRSKRTKNSNTSVVKVIDSRDVPLPETGKDYTCFLNLKENKSCLQNFLGEQLILQAPESKIVLAAGVYWNVEDVRCNKEGIDLTRLKATHEEADTRVTLHSKISLSSNIVIAARDTDIIMLLLAHYHHFAEKPHVFVTIGNGEYLDIRALSDKLGPQVCSSLLLVHALTGCDSVSFMYGIGKPTVVKAVVNQPDLLSGISLSPSLSPQQRIQMERFVCICYGHGEMRTLDEVRAHMLFSCTKPEQLPMTSDAFGAHSDRAFYVSRVWECAVESHPNLPAATASKSSWKTSTNHYDQGSYFKSH